LSDWAIWSVVEQAAKQIGIERFGAHDLRRACQAVPEEWGRSGADQVPVGVFVHPDYRTLSGIRSGDQDSGER
jgi:hypothetical protein